MKIIITEQGVRDTITDLIKRGHIRTEGDASIAASTIFAVIPHLKVVNDDGTDALTP